MTKRNQQHKYLNPTNLSSPIYCPPVSSLAMQELDGNDFKYWCLLRSDYCSFASQTQKRHETGYPFDNTLECYSKTNGILAEMFGLKSEQAVIDLTNRLCKKGWAARIPFRYSDSGKLGRNLVILDKGLADYQQFIRAIKLKLEAKVDKSRAPNGGNANKYLQQLLPFVDDANLTTSAMRVKADNILDNKLTSAHKIQELPDHQEDYEQDLDNPW